MTFKVILYLMKNLRLYNVDILENDKAFNKNYIAEKNDSEILRSPYVVP